MNGEPRQKKSPVPYAVVAVTAGAAFAIVALLHLHGDAYAIVAVVAGLCYSLIAVLNRRNN